MRRDNGDVLRKALVIEVVGKTGRGRPNMTRKRRVEEQIDWIELKKKDAVDRKKWRNGVCELSRNMR